MNARIFPGVVPVLCGFLAITTFTGCNSSGSNAPPPPPAISVTVSPGAVTLNGGGTQAFTVSVANDSANAGVTWSIGSGAGKLTGSTSSAVTYSAPAAITANSTVTLTATSVTDTSKNGSATITLNAPPAAVTGVTAACSPTSVLVGQTSQCTATVTGTGNFSNSVSWSVAGVAGGNSTTGTISSSGVYTAPAAIPAANPVTITATSTADATKSGSTTVTIGPALASIAITPEFPSIAANANQQFKATGTYTDNSTQDLTSSVTWTSSNTATATISSAGLASAVAGGTTTVKASAGTVSGATSLIVTAPPGTVIPAAAVTDSSGKATLVSNGLSIPVQLSDQDTGKPLTGAAVAVGSDPSVPGSAILLIADPTGAHPLQAVLLEGSATSSSAAADPAVTTHSSLAAADPAGSPTPIAASTGCGTGSGTVASQAITLSNLPVPPSPVTMAGAQTQFLDALNAIESEDPKALPTGMYGPLSVSRYSPTVASDCVNDIETLTASHINAKNYAIFLLEQWPPAKVAGEVADVLGLWSTRGEVLSAFNSCYYQTGTPQTIDITQVCFGDSCVFIPQIEAVPNPGPDFVVAASVTPMVNSLMTFKSESDLGVMAVGTTDSTGTGEVAVPAGSNTVCVDSPGYEKYVQPGFTVAAAGTPLDVTLTPLGQSQTYTGTYSAPFSGTASDPNGGVYSITADFTFNFTLSENSDGSVTGTASVPTNMNISVVSCPSNDTCSGDSFSVTATGNVSGSSGTFSANLTSGGTDPLTINVTGTLAGSTVTLNGTFSETFKGTATNLPPTYTTLSGTISGATLTLQ